MHFQVMPYTTLTVRQDVAKKLKASKGAGESYSDVLNRLLENQPAKCVEEWLQSIAPLEGRGVFTPAERERLKEDQKKPRDSHSRRKGHASV
jgi:predicted CopG family antitoxin